MRLELTSYLPKWIFPLFKGGQKNLHDLGCHQLNNTELLYYVFCVLPRLVQHPELMRTAKPELGSVKGQWRGWVKKPEVSRECPVHRHASLERRKQPNLRDDFSCISKYFFAWLSITLQQLSWVPIILKYVSWESVIVHNFASCILRKCDCSWNVYMYLEQAWLSIILQHEYCESVIVHNIAKIFLRKLDGP